MSRLALAFVHGINNGPEERAALRPLIESRLRKFNVGKFRSVHVVDWPSVGDFLLDLAKIKVNIPHRDRALNDVVGGIVEASQGVDGLVVVGHSFGQVWALEALYRIRQLAGRLPTRTSLLTLGGPLGNRSPVFRDYLGWVPRSHWNQPAEDFGGEEWVDIRNHDDPVPVDPLLGYEPPARAGALAISFPGAPTPFNPLSEHGSYFDVEPVYHMLSAMAGRLESQSQSA